MISLHDYRTEDALPAEMKTPERLASCRVFDIQKKKSKSIRKFARTVKRSFSAYLCGNLSALFWRWALRWGCTLA